MERCIDTDRLIPVYPGKYSFIKIVFPDFNKNKIYQPMKIEVPCYAPDKNPISEKTQANKF